MTYFTRSLRQVVFNTRRNAFYRNLLKICSVNLLKTASTNTGFVNGFSTSRYKFKMAASRGGSKSLDDVTDVEIDNGTFKYILIKVYQSKGDEEISKTIVRGFTSAGYHVDIYDEVDAKLHKMGLDCECIGGGRIQHEPDQKSIKVYGYSQGYGRADHALTTEILKKRYPEYDSITWTDEGY